MMGITETKCENCSKTIYVQKRYVREKMFCTLGCMDSYTYKISERQKCC